MAPHVPPVLVLVMVALLLAAGCTVGMGNYSKCSLTASGFYIDSPVCYLEKTTPSPTPIVLIPALSSSNQPSGYWINVDPIDDKPVGSIFNITSTTNLSVGEDILVQVYYATFSTLDYRPFSGAVGNTKVMPGKNGINTTFFSVNSSGFYPDLYIATVDAVNATAMGSTRLYLTSKQESSNTTISLPENVIDWDNVDTPRPTINSSMKPVYPHFSDINVYLNNSDDGHMQVGTIIVYAPDGIVRLFDQNGTQFGSYFDSTPLHGLGVPSGSVIKSPTAHVFSVYLGDRRMVTQVFETGGH